MLDIKKGKSIRIVLITISCILVLLVSSLCYFYGFNINTKSLLIFVAVVFCEILFFSILYLVLNAIIKDYYHVTSKGITLKHNNKIIFSIDTNNIKDLLYIKFNLINFLQMGAGYLHISILKIDIDEKYLTHFKNVKLYSISMSLKQAKLISKLLNKKLLIK